MSSAEKYVSGLKNAYINNGGGAVWEQFGFGGSTGSRFTRHGVYDGTRPWPRDRDYSSETKNANSDEDIGPL